MTRVGQAVKLQSVMTTQLVYLTMAIDLPPWAIKAIDKIRSLIWLGRKLANGGHCLIDWPKVSHSLAQGSLAGLVFLTNVLDGHYK
jgi:hypothetical protein